MGTLTEIGNELGSVADRAGTSVVGVGDRRSMGSGVLIDRALVLTNAHNVTGRVPNVALPDGQVVEAEVVGVDVDSDLALLGVEDGDHPAIAWSPEAVAVRVGMPVVGLANPGGRGLRATVGFVASTGRAFRGPRGRRISGGFEHTALAPPGSSGGPVVDLRGSLVGINTRRLGRGFYLAQSAGASLAELVGAIRSGDRPQPRHLGVGLAPADVTRRLRRALGLDGVDGLLVRLVEEESPAQVSGVREGDILVRAGGRALIDIGDLHEVLATAGESLELGLIRVNDEIDLEVRFS